MNDLDTDYGFIQQAGPRPDGSQSWHLQATPRLLFAVTAKLDKAFDQRADRYVRKMVLDNLKFEVIKNHDAAKQKEQRAKLEAMSMLRRNASKRTVATRTRSSATSGASQSSDWRRRG